MKERTRGQTKRRFWVVNGPCSYSYVLERFLRSFTRRWEINSLQDQARSEDARFLGIQLDARSLLQRSFKGVEVVHSSVLPGFSIAYCGFFPFHRLLLYTHRLSPLLRPLYSFPSRSCSTRSSAHRPPRWKISNRTSIKIGEMSIKPGTCPAASLVHSSRQCLYFPIAVKTKT